MKASSIFPILLVITSHAAADDALSGGAATYTGPIDRHAFTHPSTTLTGERRLDFKVGGSFFKRLWVSAPASTQAADGLGPLYNARSCRGCHINLGRGRLPKGPDDEAVSLVLRLSVPSETPLEARLNTVPEPTYGHQLQNFAIRGHDAEGRLGIEFEEHVVELADGESASLREPRYTLHDLAHGPLHPEAMISPRLAPPMIGLGLLEAVEEAAILALADPEDRDGDGVSGRPNRVWSPITGEASLGRFGWKAGSATVDEQSQAAFIHDLGLSVPLYPRGWGDCTERQSACRAAPDGNSPQFENLEAPRQVSDLVAHYARHLAVPARRDVDDPQVLAGERLFHDSGCAACHTPSLTTRGDADLALAAQTIHPYSDLLLHDMGEGLADGRPEGAANGREWRTAPLWGIGLTQVVNPDASFLHDGRARTLLEAILWHGGEAQAARDAVVGMSRAQRRALLRFLESL